MHDIKAIRDDPDAFDRAWASRGLAPQTPELLRLDAELRRLTTEAQEQQAIRNDLSKRIGQAKARKDEAEATRLLAEVESFKTVLTEGGERQQALRADLETRLAALPNIPAADVPAGEDEHANVEVRRWGEPFALDGAKDHVDLGAALGMMDFEAAARMSGARFVVLKGELARLERALGQFMLDFQTQERGYTEVSPPYLVSRATMWSTGQLSKFADAMGKDGLMKLEKLVAGSVEAQQTNLFSINPRMSHVSEEWRKGEPDFWMPKAPGAAKKDEKKPM